MELQQVSSFLVVLGWFYLGAFLFVCFSFVRLSFVWGFVLFVLRLFWFGFLFSLAL